MKRREVTGGSLRMTWHVLPQRRSRHHFLFLKSQSSYPGINAWAWSCALESHLKWWSASSWPDFVLFTKETPVVTRKMQLPQNSWKLLVNRRHTGLAEDGEWGPNPNLTVETVWRLIFHTRPCPSWPAVFLTCAISVNWRLDGPPEHNTPVD